MNAPEVIGYGDWNVESFDDYFARWPEELSNFPRDVVENWVHRHWQDFSMHWGDWPLGEFRFQLESMSNEDIMEIDHVGDWLSTLDYWGDELFRNALRQSTFLAKFMLEHGTTPAPIIVCKNTEGVEHPGTGQMKALQLIEGHMRLAYLRGLNRHRHPSLKDEHQVWLLDLPNKRLQPSTWGAAG